MSPSKEVLFDREDQISIFFGDLRQIIQAIVHITPTLDDLIVEKFDFKEL